MTNIIRQPFQGPSGTLIDVAMGWPAGCGFPPADIFLADGRKVQPDALGIVVCDAKDVGGLERMGFVRMPNPPSNSFSSSASTQSYVTTVVVDTAADALFGKISLGGTSAPGAPISGLAVTATVEGASAPFATTTSAADGAWRMSTGAVPARLQTIIVNVGGSYAGGVTFTK